MAKVEDILESIDKLTVVELAELVKSIEEKYGVSAAAVAAPAAGGAAVTNTAVTTESSPKTADNAMLILALAAVAMGGSVIFLKRSKEV